MGTFGSCLLGSLVVFHIPISKLHIYDFLPVSKYVINYKVVE